jgi:hypothetical protein
LRAPEEYFGEDSEDEEDEEEEAADPPPAVAAPVAAARADEETQNQNLPRFGNRVVRNEFFDLSNSTDEDDDDSDCVEVPRSELSWADDNASEANRE